MGDGKKTIKGIRTGRELRSSPEFYAEDALEHAQIVADDMREDTRNARGAAQYAIERLQEFLDVTEESE